VNREPQRVPRTSGDFLNSCLVEGDPEFEQRARKGKRRAIAFSILLETAILAGLLLHPLLGKSERIVYERTPLPPYPRIGNHHPNADHRPALQPPRPNCHCVTPITPTMNRPASSDSNPSPNGASDVPLGAPEGDPRGILDGIPNTSSEKGPERPPEVDKTARPHTVRIHVGTIEPAQILHRVEPLFPPLARQLHREGRVELHAVITTDGYIESLEVLSGDPLFYQSALAAVREWRYRPTFLSGQPVEVDTHITVLYTINR
jgi:protein TonB